MKNIITASILPTFWIIVGIAHIGTLIKYTAPGERYDGRIVIAFAIVVVPCALFAYLAGANKK